MVRVKRGVLGASVITLSLCGFGLASARAQTAAQSNASPVLNEVVVTAQKRVQNIQQVGIAITAVSGEQLSQLNIKDTNSIANIVPGVFISNLGSQGITTFTIRGVSQNDFSDQNEAPNAIYVDGAYDSFIGSAGIGMYDIERVEVLRGPQGTLFGRNATGGLVQIITRKPTREFEGYGELTGGQYGLVQFDGAVGGPLTDDLRARLSFSTKHGDGYIRNTVGGRLGGANNYSGRLQVEYEPTDRFNVLFKAHYSKDDVDGATTYGSRRAMFDLNDPAHLVTVPKSQAQYVAFCNAVFGPNFPAPVVVTATSNCAGWEPPKPNDPYVTAIDNPGIMKREFYGGTVTGNLKLSDSLSVVSITDYLKLRRDVSVDTDGTSFRMFNFGSDADSDQVSQELRLHGKTPRWDWVTGLYYIKIDHQIDTGIDALPDAYTLAKANPGVLFPFKTLNHVQQHTTSYAVFGQAEFRLNDLFSLIGGLRWSHDDKRIEINPSCVNGFLPFACAVIAPPGSVQGDGFTSANSGGLNRQSKGDWSGKFELDYHPSRDFLVYGGVTRGQKGGGFNAAAIAGISPAATPYKPEVLTNYEAGFKSTILNRTTRVNGSVFYYDYKNYQAYTLTGLTPTIFNTSATVKGFELELLTRPVSGLTLSGSAAYLDAVAHDVPSNLRGTGVNLGDQQMPESPRWSFDGLARYEWPLIEGKMAIQADGRYVAKRYFNTVNHPALTDGAHFVLNARLSYAMAGGRWEVAVWGKNLTDKVVVDSGFDLSGTNGSMPLAIEPPRWIGGSVSYRFY